MPETILNYLTLRDPVAAWSHFAGLAWALFAAVILWRLSAGDRQRQISISFFTGSMCLVYLASGVYHALRLPPEQLRFFLKLDHSAIYLLIAGTYTPIFSALLTGWWRYGSLAVIWTLAGVGILLKWLMPIQYYPVTVAMYLVVGGVGLLPAPIVVRAVGWRGGFWGLLGAAFHGAGAILDVFGWPVFVPGVFGTHELLHVLVVAGTAAHFVFIVRYVVPGAATAGTGQRLAGGPLRAAQAGRQPAGTLAAASEELRADRLQPVS
jgi:hemolysin III